VKQTIFVVEDDADIANLVKHHLEGAGFSVRLFASTNSVVSSAEATLPALFLLDIMVPGGGGMELCKRIRQHSALAVSPIIFLTAKLTESDRVTGLEQGADDYITKPFSPRELLARIRAVLRRFERPMPPSLIKAGDIEIDSAGMRITVRGAPLTTTATEFRLLEYLARHVGRVFTRDELLDAVWRDTAFVTPRSVDVYVSRLREKIEVNAEDPIYLRTVRGAGYRFEVPSAK
jgi:two-component system phosphate regulon response regulator PhoB